MIPMNLISVIRKQIMTHVRQDNHRALQTSNRYEIRSIYFDTFGLQDYYEKVAGIQIRKKLRIRGYNHQRADSDVFLEIKRKTNDFISKDRAPIRFNELEDFLESGNLERYFPHRPDFPKSRQSAERFLFHLRRKSLIPLNIVTYNREAYIGKFNHSDRITFDCNIRSKMFPSIEELYSDDNFKVYLDREFVLEFKSELPTPKWFRRIIQNHNLKRQAYSKYCHGLDAHYQGTRNCTTNEVIASYYY
ncbi:polyphosphate polymerase domain-containing protein [bacterium]|nr:polyphosphate polymerase domain-containing protein [bacterium]